MEFRSVTSLEQALDILADLGSDAQVLAGGTDVMVQYQRGELAPPTLLHIERIGALAEVDRADGWIRLGALVTHRRVIGELATSLPALAQAAGTVGGWQTQEVGTVVGNVCNASPAADTAPPLLTAEAVVELASCAGTRSLPLEDFLLGRRTTARRADELVTGLRVRPLPSGAHEVYLKVGPRSAMEVALVGLAVRIAYDPDGVVTDCRIATCSVAPVPFRAREAEAALTGSRPEPDRIAEAGAALAEAADPIDDARAGAAYRRRVLAPLLARAVGRCLPRGGA